MLLDASVATKPALSNTWAINLVKALISKATGKNTEITVPEGDDDSTEEEPSDVAETDGTDAEVKNATASGSKPSTAKVGGRRRNVPKKR